LAEILIDHVVIVVVLVVVRGRNNRVDRPGQRRLGLIILIGALILRVPIIQIRLCFWLWSRRFRLRLTRALWLRLTARCSLCFRLAIRLGLWLRRMVWLQLQLRLRFGLGLWLGLWL